MAILAHFVKIWLRRCHVPKKMVIIATFCKDMGSKVYISLMLVVKRAYFRKHGVTFAIFFNRGLKSQHFKT